MRQNFSILRHFLALLAPPWISYLFKDDAPVALVVVGITDVGAGEAGDHLLQLAFLEHVVEPVELLGILAFLQS